MASVVWIRLQQQQLGTGLHGLSHRNWASVAASGYSLAWPQQRELGLSSSKWVQPYMASAAWVGPQQQQMGTGLHGLSSNSVQPYMASAAGVESQQQRCCWIHAWPQQQLFSGLSSSDVVASAAAVLRVLLAPLAASATVAGIQAVLACLELPP